MKYYLGILFVLTGLAAEPVLAGGVDDLRGADAALRKGQFQEAIALANQAIASGQLNKPTLAVAYMRRAQAYAALGDANNALQSCTKVVELDPINPLGYSLRGNLFLQLQEYDKAIDDFTRVIALEPGRASGWAKWAVAKITKGDLGTPLQDLRRAIEVEPNDPIAYYYRANLYFYQGNYAAAAADYRKHAELVPGDPYTVIKLYQTAARIDKNAIAELNRLAATVKTRDWPYPVIELYAGKKPPQSLLDRVSGATSRKEKERACETYFYVGYWYLLNGDHDKAKSLFEQAVATGISDFNEYKTAEAEIWRLQTRP